MENIIITLMNKYGYLGILILIMIENVFPPIPSEIILCFGGFMTTNSNLTIIGVIISSTIGSILGAIILYLIGKILNKERLIKIISGKTGKILRLKKKDIEYADHWFDTKGAKTVFFCRFIPIVRSLISIPAGMSEMPFMKFITLTTLGTVIWNTVLTYLGNMMGENWHKIVDIIDKYSNIVFVFLILTFIICISYFYKKRIRKTTKTKKDKYIKTSK